MKRSTKEHIRCPVVQRIVTKDTKLTSAALKKCVAETSKRRKVPTEKQTEVSNREMSLKRCGIEASNRETSLKRCRTEANSKTTEDMQN
ncbi:hypothetical protein BsWGS_04778 [Bradybaena similaris]